MSALPYHRSRWKKLLSGDTETFLAVFGVAIAITAFYRLPWWREVLIGQSTVDTELLPMLVLIAAVFGWKSLLRRDFLWAEPAELTWLDFAGTGRVRTITARLYLSWLGRFVVLGYPAALLAAVYAAPAAIWAAIAAILAATAVLTLATARHPATTATESRYAEAIAVAALLAAAAGAPPALLLGTAGALAVLAVFRWPGGGSPIRPRVATGAGRLELVDRWADRVVRIVSVTFLDLTMMLPSSAPTPGKSLRGNAIARLAALGVLGRARYADRALLLAIAVALAFVVLPGLPPIALAAAGGYAALIPFAGGAGELWRRPGLRRWLGSSDRQLRWWHGVVLLVPAVAWTALLATGAALLGTPMPALLWLLPPVLAAATLRTATRPPTSYDNLGTTDTPFGQAPVRLIAQLVRGPDLAVLAALVLPALPLGWALLAAAALTCWGFLR